MEPKRIVVACGGTGGHVFPGLTVAQELKRRGQKYAEAEKAYRVALAKQILTERDNGVPVTIISDICKGKAEIADMPIEALKDFDYVVNGTVAEEIGLEIPEDMQEYVVEGL